MSSSGAACRTIASRPEDAPSSPLWKLTRFATLGRKEDTPMSLSKAEREAIAGDARAEARQRGLAGDAFWAFVWSKVETVLHESGDLPRPRPAKRTA